MNKILPRILEAVSYVDLEKLTIHKPASMKEVYSALMMTLDKTQYRGAANIRRLYCSLVVICSVSGGSSLYLPFFKRIKSRERFIDLVVKHLESGNAISSGMMVDALRNASPDRNVAPDALWAEQFSCLLSAVHDYLLNQTPPCSGDEIRTLLRLIMGALIDTCSGRAFYIPLSGSLLRVLRDRALWNDFDGSNVRELSKRYGLSAPSVYAILDSCRKEARKNV
ncbi:Mor transcription activator family protein [Aeromonas caviae]|uniref:Mor transcription activator family protein n=1 Tax=Aeromonas caviae TaxID=648 RepID=UPI003EC7A267